MASDWLETTLGDVIELKRGYDLPQKDRTSGQFPLVSSSGVTDYHNVAKVKGPGVVTGRYGTLGQVFYVSDDFWPLNTTLYVRDFKGNDPRFISYFLTGIDYLAYSDKAAVPGLNRNHLHQANILFPSNPNEQRAIAHILGTLDDKIELNRRRNQALEAMARALFKDWFVDFGPVRAKMEGQDPYLPADLWQLFPERLDDEGKPEGWKVGVLGDVAENPRRGIQPEQIKPQTPYIALEHMPRKCITLSDWGVADSLESNKYQFFRGEILFGKLRPYFHKVGVAPVDGICSTDIVVVAPKDAGWFGFVLCYLSSVEFVEYTNAGSTGTKMPRTSWNLMASYEVPIPSRPIAEAFATQLRPYIDSIFVTIHESKSLSGLRDTLLPKLISGELRVADAEKFIERIGV